MTSKKTDIDTVRASRAGHAFHERWAARRALQLLFPNDGLNAIAVEGISHTETGNPGKAAEEVADLVFYYGSGDNFASCDKLETVQFKYKVDEEAVTAAYLKKTIEKFADTIVGYDKKFSSTVVDTKISFVFVTNTLFSASLWEALAAVINGTTPNDPGAATQAKNLRLWCNEHQLSEPERLFKRIVFKAGEEGLAAQDRALKRTLTDWSVGEDIEARARLFELQNLVIKKAGPQGQSDNLIRREDVLNALDCEVEDLFPAERRFAPIGEIIPREELIRVTDLIRGPLPVLVHADGGVGKTVFVQNLATLMADDFEVVVFDCFGGGSYRSENHSRHLPKIGLLQIVNELAVRTLCDPILPSGDDHRKILRAVRRRLVQASKAVRAQSKKSGLLLIIDAADNAQLEADVRGEQSFPKLLLHSLHDEPIENVSLLLTARPYRKASVVDRAVVAEIELGPFTEEEAREFLAVRRPGSPDIEIKTAITRSRRNARVLDYLVQTWDRNVVANVTADAITVREIIAQHCNKIVDDLRVAGWSNADITEFFVAISLLPPPIPLEDLALALGWAISHVSTAASDLAPMLEMTSHGAIFRDEPTETYVRETYSQHSEAQRAIADRLLAAQAISAYAAEALPHFLVVIKDSDRAFALADNTSYPKSVQSDFGKRRLALARLRSTFRLAAAESDFDRLINLSMRLAEVTTANLRGDEYIRRSPELAILLGDSDSYRRLVADRAGWRGAKSARLTIAHHFAGDHDEAEIQCENTIRWINWQVQQSRNDSDLNHSSPDAIDYAAILFHNALTGSFVKIDRNLSRWNDNFSLEICTQLVRLMDLLNSRATDDLVKFVASENCHSHVLKLKVLSTPWLLTRKNARSIASSIGGPNAIELNGSDNFSPPSSKDNVGVISAAALSALILVSRAAAAEIINKIDVARPTAYDYSERYGFSRVWMPIRHAAIKVWSSGKMLQFYHLLPREVALNKKARSVLTKDEARAYLKSLVRPDASDRKTAKKNESSVKARFNDREANEIADCIALALALLKPLEGAILSRSGFTEATIAAFLSAWQKSLRNDVSWQAEQSASLLVRTVGLGCLGMLLAHADKISRTQADEIVTSLSDSNYYVSQKIDVLKGLARFSSCHEAAGKLAQKIAEHIRLDDNIDQRGEHYLCLAEALMPMSVDEAREYYRQGLAQLDQMGGESYEQIYSLLNYAATQKGGFISLDLGQRLMNLCQTIISQDAGKFSWTLYGKAAAKSIGFSAVAKIIRWHDQDVAQFSYGLPQLVCSLAEYGHLDPLRAAFILTICDDHGWWDWSSGEAVSVLLKLASSGDRRRIFKAIIDKNKLENSSGGWPGLWRDYLATASRFDGVLEPHERVELECLLTEAQIKRDEDNSRSNSPAYVSPGTPARLSDAEIEQSISQYVAKCDRTKALSIDATLKELASHERLPYDVRQRFISSLRSACSYAERLPFLIAIAESAEIYFSQSIEIIAECIAAWKDTSAHLSSQGNMLAERIFETKGVELFEGQFSNINRGLNQLASICNDSLLVIELLIQKVSADEVELDGDQWIQLATALCPVASDFACVKALELILGGRASRVADEIGEGPLRPDQRQIPIETDLLADLIWHLLGDSDAYVRWMTARGIDALVRLGLIDDIDNLLARFDVRTIPLLDSDNYCLSFQNSQQWLLMGLARATLRNKNSLATLRPKLFQLAMREDLHIINKLHLVRTINNIDLGLPDKARDELQASVDEPPKGVQESDEYLSGRGPKTNFDFDYNFAKIEISNLARRFNVPQSEIAEAMGSEISRIWPEAKSMEFFKGRSRYEWDLDDRYEFFREHVQRHALLSAATTLSRRLPVVIRSYEVGDEPSWIEWRNRYDVTFNDGSWLSDRKDKIATAATERLLRRGSDHQETFIDLVSLTGKLGLVSSEADALFPIYGSWRSPDGVSVNITSALSDQRGSIGRCHDFAKQTSSGFWLPEFWDGGYYDESHRSENPFQPFVWAPDRFGLGIDEGDELAAVGPAIRPRLGIELTSTLGLHQSAESNDWLAADGELALRSQVWGNWKPEPSQRRSRFHDDGEMLFASPIWLANCLSVLGKKLVFTVVLRKYKSSWRDDDSNGLKLALLGLWQRGGPPRFWQANKASIADY